ncbi:hypothetical protein [Azospirillum melinis]
MSRPSDCVVPAFPPDAGETGRCGAVGAKCSRKSRPGHGRDSATPPPDLRILTQVNELHPRSVRMHSVNAPGKLHSRKP